MVGHAALVAFEAEEAWSTVRQATLLPGERRKAPLKSESSAFDADFRHQERNRRSINV